MIFLSLIKGFVLSYSYFGRTIHIIHLLAMAEGSQQHPTNGDFLNAIFPLAESLCFVGKVLACLLEVGYYYK